MTKNNVFNLQCPVPKTDYQYITMAHGGGGRLMRGLINDLIVPAFDNPLLNQLGDSVVLPSGKQRIAFTTDSYVVDPLFFPGGDIGTLAINGTVNDLAMCGARPQYLSAAFILEEGLSFDTLWQIIVSMKQAAKSANVQLVTGDTKVVDRGKGDGIYINTAGIGIIDHRLSISPANIEPEDVILLNGDIGRHGIAVLAKREGLAFESNIESDCAPLADLVEALIVGGVEVHCMRDLTRGGLGCALVEIAQTAKRNLHIEEKTIPVREDVKGACEILGLDPLYIANEGRFICFVPKTQAEKAMKIMRSNPLGDGTSIIGRVEALDSGIVTMKCEIGTTRVLDMPSGEQLPRIC